MVVSLKMIEHRREYPFENKLVVLAFGSLLTLLGISYFIALPIPVNLILMSTLIVFIGSVRSLKLLNTHGHNGERLEKEVITQSDAYKFPFIGSITLFGLYLAFKYLDKDMVNLVISIYFLFVGVITLTTTFSPFFESFMPPTILFDLSFNLPYMGDIAMKPTIPNIISVLSSIILSYYYFMTKHFILNNIIGISFCIQGISSISMGSYKIAATILIGLFFYDIFWVFGTDVMVTVAKSFDGPIKLLFPKV